MRLIIIPLLLLLLCISCNTSNKSTQRTTPVATEVTSTKVVEKTSYIHDTVYVEIPAQQAERTTKDSASFLETDYAASLAMINKDGTLYHALNNKPQKKPVPHDTPVLSKDSIAYVDKTVPVPYPVEKQLTKWERLSIEYFKWLLPLFALSLGWIFRKPIVAVVRRFI